MSRVREATAQDVEGVTALINRAYLVEAFFTLGDRVSAAQVRDRMNRGRFLLIEDGSRLTGCVFVSARDGLGYFGTLSVEPAQQGQGLGSRLVTAAEEWCRDQGCAEMEIEVVNLRTELPPYYRRLGYVEHGVRVFPDPERATQPCHFIVMRKSLT